MSEERDELLWGDDWFDTPGEDEPAAPDDDTDPVAVIHDDPTQDEEVEHVRDEPGYLDPSVTPPAPSPEPPLSQAVPPVDPTEGLGTVDELLADAVERQVAEQRELNRLLSALESRLDDLTQSGLPGSAEDPRFTQLSRRLDELQAILLGERDSTRADLDDIVRRLREDADQRTQELRAAIDWAGTGVGDDRLDRLAAAGDDLRGELERLRQDVTTELAQHRTQLAMDLAEQHELLVATTGSTRPDDASNAAVEGVERLHGAITALADEVADAIASRPATATRADIERLETLVRMVASETGSGGGDPGPGLERIRGTLEQQSRAIESLSDAVLGLSTVVQRAPQETAEAVEATQRLVIEELSEVGYSIQAGIESVRERMDRTAARIRESAASIGEQTDAVLGQVAGAVAEEAAAGRAQLQDAGVRLGEVIDRVRQLEASLVGYLVERDERITFERAAVVSELTARLTEGLSKRDRRRLASRVGDEPAAPIPARARPPVEDPDDGPEPFVVSRRPVPQDAARRSPSPASTPGVSPPRPAGARVRRAPETPSSAAPGREGIYPRRSEAVPARMERAPDTTPAPASGRDDPAAMRRTLSRVKGVGPARQSALIDTFGTLEALREASVEELAAVPGIPRGVATALHEALSA